jgi:metal-dependent hydrolase (beta-lactamase superfamily II)
LAVEATQALFNLMGSAGLSGLKLIPDGQREEDLNGVHAVATNEARTLVAHIFPAGSYQSEEELMSLIVADSQKKCNEGSFSSGTERTNENGKPLYTSYANCEAGDYQLIERVAIAKRKAGGVIIYGVADTYVGEGGGNPVSPPELTDPDFYFAAASAAE